MTGLGGGENNQRESHSPAARPMTTRRSLPPAPSTRSSPARPAVQSPGAGAACGAGRAPFAEARRGIARAVTGVAYARVGAGGMRADGAAASLRCPLLPPLPMISRGGVVGANRSCPPCSPGAEFGGPVGSWRPPPWTREWWSAMAAAARSVNWPKIRIDTRGSRSRKHLS